MSAPRGAPTQIPESWLRESEHLEAAERLDRLAGDADLMRHLGRDGFVGLDYDYFAVEMAKYGLAVIGGWIRRGLIFEKCRTKGYGGLPPPPTGALDDPETVYDLSAETVAISLERFRADVLIPGRWDPLKGASLRTYFIGQCLMRFPNVYRSWHAETLRNAFTEAVEMADLESRVLGHHDSPEHDVITAMAASEELASIKDPRLRRALVMVSAGYKQSEIAEGLGVTEKTVERMLANHRSRVRQRDVG